jgi:hypothetical protein
VIFIKRTLENINRLSTACTISASYYTIDDQTLIYYRGTDFDFLSVNGAIEFLKDFGNGWLSSFNALNPDSINIPVTGIVLVKNQPYYAHEFYELATEAKIFQPIWKARSLMM